MSKGLAFELDKKLVLEKIQEKIGSRTRGSFTISNQDFSVVFEPVFETYRSLLSNHLDEILILFEKESRGRLHLKSVTPQEEGYTIEFGMINIESLDKLILTLSKEKGLCVIVDGKEKCYKVSGQRYQILDTLEKKYKPTSKIAEEVFGSGYKKEYDRTVMSQMGDIREKIETKLSLDGSSVIENNKGSGYRIGKGFKFIKK
jgi:hypothetical protein